MVDEVREMMGQAYPEVLDPSNAQVSRIVLAEERRFIRTLDLGLGKLVELVNKLQNQGLVFRNMQMAHLEGEPKGAGPEKAGPRLLGRDIFTLYDTHGLPGDFIEDALRDFGIEADWAGFEKAMEEQRAKARASWKGGAKEAANPADAKIADRFTTEPDF